MHAVSEFLLNIATDIKGPAGFTPLDFRRIIPMTAADSGCGPQL